MGMLNCPYRGAVVPNTGELKLCHHPEIRGLCSISRNPPIKGRESVTSCHKCLYWRDDKQQAIDLIATKPPLDPKLFEPVIPANKVATPTIPRPAVVPPSPTSKCSHLGVDTGKLLPCPECNGSVMVKVFACGVYGECTIAKRVNGVQGCCGNCPSFTNSYLPYDNTRPLVRNLIYHVAPLATNETWRRNIDQLLKRIHLFNGRRLVGVSIAKDMQPPEAVIEAFKGEVDEFLFRPNTALHEVDTFIPNMDKLLSSSLIPGTNTLDPNQVTFFGHTKGVTRPLNEAVTVHRWTDLMYETCLDYWELVEPLLEQRSFAASFKKVGPSFQNSTNSWHYSGTFWWFRNAAIFAKEGWRYIDKQWWGVESWPGVHFSASDGGAIFHEGSTNMNLYDYNYFTSVVEPQYRQWQQSNKPIKEASVKYLEKADRAAINTSKPNILTRNLIYHVAPLKSNEAWRENVQQISKALNTDMFNGKRVVAVVYGEGLHSLEEVQREFAKHSNRLLGCSESESFIQWLALPNDPVLRETATLAPLLEAISNNNPTEATFYAHTKGNSTTDGMEGAARWRNAMYDNLLTEEALTRVNAKAVVGACKLSWVNPADNPYPTKLAVGNWMFAGTFFWFRHDAVFTSNNWNRIPNDRYGAEAWLSSLFNSNEAESIYQPWDADLSSNNRPNPYDPLWYFTTRESDVRELLAKYPTEVVIQGGMMDSIHRDWILRVLLLGNFNSILEIGVFKGYSSATILTALETHKAQQATFCDIYFTPEFHQTVGLNGKNNITLRETRSLELLQEPQDYDFYLVDGDHSTDNVVEEATLILSKRPRVVMAHDTNMGCLPHPTSSEPHATVGQNGPPLLKQLFQAAGYYCLEDDLMREDMYTERGMFFAARDLADYKLGLQAYKETFK